MNNSLLPPGSSMLERRLAKACGDISALSVPVRQLWNPDACPASFLPYLAWAFSVDRWDEQWPETVKRQVIKDAYFVHRHKGTLGALRRVVEPFGYLIRIDEWWQTGGQPGTFRLDIGVQEQGISEETYTELERLIAGARPCSRHLTGLSITLDAYGALPVAAACYSGDELTVYPYTPETITVSGPGYTAAAVQLIDLMEVRV
ncbi:phage tail protein I [Lonsdalea populi]|uniref:phage tail protein I n=1 Tax=Lonsdalea populi TaxID=1172565 RepID=UPI000A1E43EA|nr:phage tail protein I [Lonsdalea populi]OSM94642.1 phage tail protein I [Lonsdalea populi]QPQ23734.1 phage tail protein I [Lonsdalea populi]RAT40463.1 phage tail protein I [Lonsdalea populi]RAT52508.1 phage tail protein I [Lonsdalea populi]RAT59393.1 phage tail protein I [Lonsdalea populi]